MGRDWGECAHERWAAAADFLLVSRSRRVVGTLSSSYSELAAAARGASEAWLFDPIHQLKGRRRARLPTGCGATSTPRSGFLPFRSDATWPPHAAAGWWPGHARAWARAHCVLKDGPSCACPLSRRVLRAIDRAPGHQNRFFANSNSLSVSQPPRLAVARRVCD